MLRHFSNISSREIASWAAFLGTGVSRADASQYGCQWRFNLSNGLVGKTTVLELSKLKSYR